MNSLLIKNAFLITLDDRVIPGASVLIKDGRIEEISTKGNPGSEQACVIDAQGKIALPGFINTHHHLYSTFARGMSVPGTPAKNFVEILEKLWWKLDELLNEEDVYLSSLVPLMECVKNGVTTLIDHHESQAFQEGSLDVIERAVKKTGIRACLCLGASDRFGKGKEGLKENERFLKKLSTSGLQPSTLSGMVGLHASFTVQNDTLEQSVALSKKYGVGIHVHVAEDQADEKDSLNKYKMSVVERLKKHGALGPKSICVHCVHVNEREKDILLETDTNVVHNPESNMNNAVGCADVLGMLDKGILVGLGTDGMSSDMLAQMRCAYLLHRHNRQDPRVAFLEAPRMLLQNNAKICKRIFGLNLGQVKVGNPADIILLDYIPPTPLNGENVLGHLIFGMVDAAVDTTISNGEILMKDKKLVEIDEEEVCSRSREQAKKFWERINT